jgi:hypothetical protein
MAPSTCHFLRAVGQHLTEPLESMCDGLLGLTALPLSLVCSDKVLLGAFPAEGNVMLNDLVSTTAGTAVLYSSMLVYLALGMTTTQYALRQSLDTIFFGEGASFTWRRHVGTFKCCQPVGFSMADGLPGGQGKA